MKKILICVVMLFVTISLNKAWATCQPYELSVWGEDAYALSTGLEDDFTMHCRVICVAGESATEQEPVGNSDCLNNESINTMKGFSFTVGGGYSDTRLPAIIRPSQNVPDSVLSYLEGSALERLLSYGEDKLGCAERYGSFHSWSMQFQSTHIAVTYGMYAGYFTTFRVSDSSGEKSPVIMECDNVPMD